MLGNESNRGEIERQQILEATVEYKLSTIAGLIGIVVSVSLFAQMIMTSTA